MPSESDDEALNRLKKLADQLDAAKQSAVTTVKEVTRAKQTVERVKRETKLLDTSARPKRKRKAGKKR